MNIFSKKTFWWDYKWYSLYRTRLLNIFTILAILWTKCENLKLKNQKKCVFRVFGEKHLGRWKIKFFENFCWNPMIKHLIPLQGWFCYLGMLSSWWQLLKPSRISAQKICNQKSISFSATSSVAVFENAFSPQNTLKIASKSKIFAFNMLWTDWINILENLRLLPLNLLVFPLFTKTTNERFQSWLLIMWFSPLKRSIPFSRKKFWAVKVQNR